MILKAANATIGRCHGGQVKSVILEINFFKDDCWHQWKQDLCRTCHEKEEKDMLFALEIESGKEYFVQFSDWTCFIALEAE